MENIGCHGPWGVCIGNWQDRSWKQQLSFMCPKKFGLFNCNGWSITESDLCFGVFFWLLEKRFVDGGGLEYSCRKQEGHLEYVWMQNIREETHMEETPRKQRVYWHLHVQTEGRAWQDQGSWWVASGETGLLRGCYLSLGTQNQVTWVQRRSGVMNSFCLGHTEFEIAHPVSPWSWDEPSLPFKLEKETRCWSVRVEAMTPSERIPKVTRWRLSLGLSNIQGGGWRWKSSRKRQRIEIEQGSQRLQQRMEGPEVSNRVFLTDSVVSEQNPYSLLETKPFWYLS